MELAVSNQEALRALDCPDLDSFLGIAAGVAAFWLGLSVMDEDEQPGLEFVSGGAGMVLLFVAASFLPF